MIVDFKVQLLPPLPSRGNDFYYLASVCVHMGSGKQYNFTK